jgi:hypothetical protein
MPDELGMAKAILEEYATGTPLDGIAIRGARLEPTDAPPVLLLEIAGWLRAPTKLPTMTVRLGVTAYGSTDRQAMTLWRAASDILHRRGPLIATIDGADVLLYQALDETGPSERDDPDTRWPARYGVFDLFMADRTLG